MRTRLLCLGATDNTGSSSVLQVLSAALGIALLVCLAVAPARAADAGGRKPGRLEHDWPTFRGADRTAVSPDTGLLQAWPEGGPRVVYDIKGPGRGYSSVVVAGDRIYTLGDNLSIADDKDEYLMAFSRDEGKPLWKLKTGAPWNQGQESWQSSRATPTVAGDLIYAVTAEGELVCAEAATGGERWRTNLKSKFGGNKGDGWGYSESVLIDGDRLICTPGGEKATMVALDKKTGEPIWQTSRPGDRGAGHASAVISHIGSTKVYVQVTASGPMGVRADDGKLLWTYDIDRTTAVIPTPIVRDDLVFFTAGYGRGGALLKQVPASSDEIKIEEVYPLKKELGSKHGGVVLVGDYVYGGMEDSNAIFCADLMTGEIKWKARGSGQGSAATVAADGCLYIHYANGTMSLVKASPEKYEELGSFLVPDVGQRPSWAHPVIAGGRLYLREQDRIICYDLHDQGG
ncbi:MAG TPA: PQQ-binding-like beta-propeller repeat protein [Pirellulales bacterium]|nr:PQQ-binding-like beta-propeller repeat protein [Pirellulales bacterium]